ncbi:hypothetical protein H8356DRAFT_1318628 [Neocallimastix lanati (nom. inval.)]|nr:hypothetical protein H8356DRAFT_1318628 [Neocallimastix sp. JGI-2020a]
MPFISYEISDENGDTSFLSYTQPLQNYDISIMPNTSYKYIISEDTAFHVRWRTNETCQPIYDFKKKIAITSVNDIFSHDCKLNVKIYAYDILNFEELYNQDNLPELLIVQFNDVYELRNTIFNNLNNSLSIEITENVRQSYNFRKSINMKIILIIKALISLSILIIMVYTIISVFSLES